MALKLSAVFRHTAQEALKCRSWVPKAIFQGLSSPFFISTESLCLCAGLCVFSVFWCCWRAAGPVDGQSPNGQKAEREAAGGCCG